MTTTAKGRDRPRHYICGHCAAAARTSNPKANHRRCRGGPCECGAVEHRFGPDLAQCIARSQRLDLDQVYAAHGRKRRVLTPEQREAAIARLTEARARRVA